MFVLNAIPMTPGGFPNDDPTVMQLSDSNLYQCWLYDNMRFDESRTVAEEIMGAGKHLPEIFLMKTARYIRQKTDTTLSPTGYGSHYDTGL